MKLVKTGLVLEIILFFRKTQKKAGRGRGSNFLSKTLLILSLGEKCPPPPVLANCWKNGVKCRSNEPYTQINCFHQCRFIKINCLQILFCFFIAVSNPLNGFYLHPPTLPSIHPPGADVDCCEQSFKGLLPPSTHPSIHPSPRQMLIAVRNPL